MVFPFVWLILTSLREQNTVFSGPFFPTVVHGGGLSRGMDIDQLPAALLEQLVDHLRDGPWRV